MNFSLELAHYLHDLRANTLPVSTRDSAVRCVLDLLGAAAAGFDNPGTRAVRRAARDMFGPGRSTVWFTGTGAHPSGALMANSLAASALDLDDGYRAARGHPGAAAIPAAWAVLEEASAGADCAEDFLAAIVAGYEAGIRMSLARLSYAPSGAWSPYAVIAAAGKLRGVSPETISQAFGIAAQTAPALPGLAGLMGSDVKEGIAWGSVTGLAALRLAESGFTGPSHIFDEPTLFSASRMLDGLGGTPLIEGTYFKPFACCRHIHAALDAYTALVRQHALEPESIEHIEVHTYRATFNLSNLPRPKTLVQAQYSVPFCVALCALRGPDALLPMRELYLADPSVLDLADRITVHHDPQIEPLFPARSPARVTIQLSDGTSYASPVTDPRGDPGRTLSWGDLQAKFLTSTTAALVPEHQKALLDAMDELRNGDVGPLQGALRSPAVGQP